MSTSTHRETKIFHGTPAHHAAANFMHTNFCGGLDRAATAPDENAFFTRLQFLF